MNANPPGVVDPDELLDLVELEEELELTDDGEPVLPEVPELPPATPTGQHQTHSEPAGAN